MPPAPADILLVDDHLFSLHVLTNLLGDRGYQVRQANSGKLALRLVRAKLPDLILLDVKMSEMDGYEVCARLKANPTTAEIPIIFLTGLVTAADKVAAFEAGGADYITKPFEIAEVLVRIRNQLTMQQQRRQLLSQNQQLQQEIRGRQQLASELKQANRELQKLATIDQLTQVANRRRFDDYLQQLWQQTPREHHLLSLILGDIDHFKTFNDHYGHPRGDTCLQRVAKALQQAVHRSTDLVTRYGGEEFALILPNTSASGAAHLAQQIKQKILDLQIPHAASPTAAVITISLGVTTGAINDQTTPQDLIAAADTALYTAKAKGRNGWYVHLTQGYQVSAEPKSARPPLS
jgi:diguanylate cyclase (GGDEF)-like protein